MRKYKRRDGTTVVITPVSVTYFNKKKIRRIVEIIPRKPAFNDPAVWKNFTQLFGDELLSYLSKKAKESKAQ